uniref:Rubis-subs-bind domain-containing protein n=1 Tax=Steinernema glaseri TaxID=37863 RepID=A0A1I8ASJ0_9BILA
MTTTDYAIAREAITNVRWSTDLDRITPAIGNLANVSLSSEEVERLKLKDFLECCVTRGLLRQLYANMILHRVQRPKEVKKAKKGRESSLLKKTIAKRIQKNRTNYVCVKKLAERSALLLGDILDPMHEK